MTSDQCDIDEEQQVHKEAAQFAHKGWGNFDRVARIILPKSDVPVGQHAYRPVEGFLAMQPL